VVFICRCDAEPGALSEYILALLKHNVPENEMRKELSSQLEEFLEKGAHYFGAIYVSPSDFWYQRDLHL
jgi:RNA-binding protein 26